MGEREVREKKLVGEREKYMRKGWWEREREREGEKTLTCMCVHNADYLYPS